MISATVLFAPGCATQSQMQVVAPAPESTTVVAIRIEPCVDRTGTKGRDLAREATRLLTERLQGIANFALRVDAPLILTCEVKQFADGMSGCVRADAIEAEVMHALAKDDDRGGDFSTVGRSDR